MNKIIFSSLHHYNCFLTKHNVVIIISVTAKQTQTWCQKDLQIVWYDWWRLPTFILHLTTRGRQSTIFIRGPIRLRCDRQPIQAHSLIIFIYLRQEISGISFLKLSALFDRTYNTYFILNNKLRIIRVR